MIFLLIQNTKVVGMATYCAIVVPRAQLLAEAVAQGMFMFSMYQLFCLILGYCGGEAEMIRYIINVLVNQIRQNAVI